MRNCSGHVDGAAGGARARAAAGERGAGAEPAAGARGPRAHPARAPPRRARARPAARAARRLLRPLHNGQESKFGISMTKLISHYSSNFSTLILQRF